MSSRGGGGVKLNPYPHVFMQFMAPWASFAHRYYTKKRGVMDMDM